MKIKICGITNLEDTEILNEYLPDYCGFIFAESKRRVSPQKVKVLSQALNKEIKTVGVFVNEDINTISETAKFCNLHALQLHGDEDGVYIKNLRQLCPDKVIIKAIPARDSTTMEQILNCGADYFLFDAFSPDARGGTGKKADWELIQAVTAAKSLRFFLAGGIGVENIAEAVKLNPYCLDLSGSIEKPGGGKSLELTAELFKKLEMIR